MALYDKGEEYKAPMKRFFRQFISIKNKQNDKEQIKDSFLKAVHKASSIKEKPFHLYSSLNFSLMDSILVALMKTPFEDENKIKSSYNNLIKNDEYISLIHRGQVF